MKSHTKKMIAPIIVAVLMIIYYAIYFGLIISAVIGIWKFLLGIIPVAFAAVTIAVCIERINEIRKGEEDDISKY